MLDIARVCLRNYRALIFSKVHERNCIHSWFGAKQLNKKKPTFIQKHTSSHLAGGPVALFCSKITYSKLLQNSRCGNMKTCQQHNFMQKFGFSKDPKPIIPSSGLEIPVDSEHWGPYIVSRIHRLEESSRFRGYSTLRWGVSGFVVLFGFVYLFRDSLRDNVADEVADVASRSMADENVILKAHGMTKGVLNRLVSEPETISLVSSFIKEVLKQDNVRTTAVEFTASILNHPETQAKFQEIIRNTIQFVLNNKETKATLLNFVKSLIDDQQTKDACHKFLMSLTEDPKIRELMTEFFKSVLASQKFQTEAVMLGIEVTNRIVRDKEIQQGTGDALWSAIKYGVTPYWFRES